MTNITQFTPGGKSPRTHGNTTEGRRDMDQLLDDQYQQGFVSGIAAARASQSRYERIEPIGDAIAWGGIGVLVGLAIALFLIAPAF